MFEVAEGKSFVLETEDNLSGRIRSESDLPTLENLKPYTDFTPQMHNPLAGPVFVKGVDKGDLLVVEIEDIVVADQGHSCIIPRFDPMAGQEAWPDLDLAFAKIIRHEPRPSGTTRDGRAHYNSKISWDLAPFIGAICVVPNTGTKSNPIRTVIAFMKFQKGRPISGDLWGYRLERKCFSKPVRCGATKLNIATQVYMEYMYTIRVLPKIVLVAKAQGNSSESLDIEPSHDQRIYPNIRL